MKTCIEVVKSALHQYALTTKDTQEMAMASHALWLMKDRENVAGALFIDEPATSGQYAKLHHLGYRGNVKSKSHASRMIEELKARAETLRREEVELNCRYRNTIR